ncbi:unnamed protein product, partial [Didymodactylos carnosus]
MAASKCSGCNSMFCKIHFFEHRQQLKSELECVIYEHDMLNQQYFKSSSQNNTENELKLFNIINEWENDTMSKIRLAAEQFRQRFQQVIGEKKEKVRKEFQTINHELRTRQNVNDYVESDLSRWKDELTELKEKLEMIPTSIKISTEISDRLNWSSMVQINDTNTNNTEGAIPINRVTKDQEQWSNVDQYINDLLLPPDSVLDGVLEASAAAGLPP